MKTVLIIGGGITGLSAIYELDKWKKENNADVRLVLAEAGAELGGKISTAVDGEFIMETGADSIVSRKLDEGLIEELGLQDEVVYNATGQSFIYVDGELKSIPADSVFGIPAGVKSLAESTLVSAEGKVEALKDFYTDNDRFTGKDSVGSFLEFFLGKELVEKQIAPVLSGVYSGKLSDFTIASTLPAVLEYKEKYGSIIRGFEKNLPSYQNSAGKKFLSFKNGLRTLIDAYEDHLTGTEVLKNHSVERIENTGGRYAAVFRNGSRIEADSVVLSVPHTAVLGLFEDEELDRILSNLETGSLISVYAGFSVPDEVLPADGTGFITANEDELSCNACTWTSRKWEHTSRNKNLLVRLFYKSAHPRFAELKEMSEEKLLHVAMEDIRNGLGITAEPVSHVVTKWTDKMPKYKISHPQTVEELESRLEKDYPGVLLAGCSYYGVGIPDCMENGIETARKVIGRIE